MLPDYCYAVHPISDEVVMLKRFESGYYPARPDVQPWKGQEIADELNRQLDVTKAQATAMLAGSMFGWYIPAANPDIYDEDGKLIGRSTHPRQGKERR